MLFDLVNRISSERKCEKAKKNFLESKFEYSQGPLGDVLRTSWGGPKSFNQGRPLNVRLRRPVDAISGRPQDVRLGSSRDGQIGSLEDVLETLKGDALGTSWPPIFARWGDKKFSTIDC